MLTAYAPGAGLRFVDIFCGAGGSSCGLTEAGYELVLGANHWDRAIETHARNFPDAEHICEDVNRYDMRRLPAAEVLWASPICTEGSPAGGVAGHKRPTRSRMGQTDMLVQELGYVSRAGMERTRATFHDVIRATEVHRYLAVIVENVPDVVHRWELFDWWLEGMSRLGYDYQLVSVSSAHVGDDTNPHAPQWRDRLYITFTRKGIPAPDLTLRPRSWCFACERDVEGVQTWAPSMRGQRFMVGKYRRLADSHYGQYWYTCPGCGRRCEPYVAPAASAIDWSDLGTRIGDLDDPLKPNTIARIKAGLVEFARPILATARDTIAGALPLSPFMVNSNHDDTRVYPAGGAPLPTRTTKIGDGLVCPPLLVPCGGSRNETAAPVDLPLRTLTGTDGNAGMLVTHEPFIAMLRNNMTTTSVWEPYATFAASGTHHALIVPYYTKGVARSSWAPYDTITGHDRFAMVSSLAPAVEDCLYRMTKPRESLNGQRFLPSYVVLGNLGEQTMQAGNAVSVNAAHWIGRQVRAALDSRSAP